MKRPDHSPNRELLHSFGTQEVFYDPGVAHEIDGEQVETNLIDGVAVQAKEGAPPDQHDCHELTTPVTTASPDSPTIEKCPGTGDPRKTFLALRCFMFYRRMLS